jgi:hypothetical protein
MTEESTIALKAMVDDLLSQAITSMEKKFPDRHQDILAVKKEAEEMIWKALNIGDPFSSTWFASITVSAIILDKISEAIEKEAKSITMN